ncbi:hypothetical protein AA0115_g9324 [Alternaria tenuissima]|nr:hypothetical protein AA0115_g9324 [Alternaria tenuissima]
MPAATGGASVDVTSYEILGLREPMKGVYQTVQLPQYFFKPHTRNPDFFGRQDVLHTLAEGLNPSVDSRSRSFALCGAGGLGKTSVAVEYAYRNKSMYEAIFILQASDSEKLAQSFAEISLALGLESEAGDQIVSKNLVFRWLSQPVRRMSEGTAILEDQNQDIVPWLLVFDNADDLSILRDYWPESEYGSILVTSRDPLAKTRTYVAISSGLELEPFVEVEAGLLLRKLTGLAATADIQSSELVARKLSGLPLAIMQIAGTMVRRDLSFEEFSSLYDQEALRADLHRANEFASTARTLYTTWNFHDLSQSALSLINVITFFDPDQISEDILMMMSSVEVRHRPEEYPVTATGFMDARSELAKSSLVKRNRERKELVIHRIIQDAARLRMQPNVVDSCFISVTHLLYTAWPFSEFEFSTARWRLCEPLISHVANLYRIYQQTDALKAVKEGRPELARLFMDFGWYFIERGILDEARPYLQSSLELCDLVPESTYITRGDAEGCLAQLLNLTNDYKAAMVHAKIAAGIFQVHDPLGWRMAQAQNEVCEAYIAASKYEEALQQAELSIKSYFALPEDDYPDWAVMNKAYALYKLGRLDEANDTLEDYLDLRAKKFGPMDSESLKTGQCLYLLGLVRLAQGRPRDGLTFYTKALDQYLSTIGPNHFRVAMLYHRTGELHLAIGQLINACDMFERAIRTFDERRQYATQVARTLYSLALTQEMAGRHEDSARTSEKYSIAMRKLSKEHGRELKYKDLDDLIRNNWD